MHTRYIAPAVSLWYYVCMGAADEIPVREPPAGEPPRFQRTTGAKNGTQVPHQNHRQNRLHPYYLVYVKQDGLVVYNHMQAKKTLDALRLHCKGNQTPFEELCSQFNYETSDGRKMKPYSGLLDKSIRSIIKTEDEKEVLSLFKAGGTTAPGNKLKGKEDFKLISFVVIR